MNPKQVSERCDMRKSHRNGMDVCFLLSTVCACAGLAAEPLPKIWMSTHWREPFDETVRMCAAQGVDVVEVPTWTTNHCAYSLSLLRKYTVKEFQWGQTLG